MYKNKIMKAFWFSAGYDAIMNKAMVVTSEK